MTFQHVGLHPPGARDALGSGGRKEKDEPRMRRVRVEMRLECGHGGEVAERGPAWIVIGGRRAITRGAIAGEESRPEEEAGEQS
jgi:hypothetical protein